MNFITENQTEYQALFTFWGDEESEVMVCFDAKRHFTEEEKQEVFRQVATGIPAFDIFASPCLVISFLVLYVFACFRADPFLTKYECD